MRRIDPRVAEQVRDDLSHAEVRVEFMEPTIREMGLRENTKCNISLHFYLNNPDTPPGAAGEGSR